MDSSDKNRTVTFQRNPLLIDPVINRVFEYLPLEDLKQCRLVCQEWNSASTQILNQQSKVNLISSEKMANFLEFYKACDNQPFPFTTFYFFCETENNGITADCEQLTDLFNTLRKSMTTLIFMNFRSGLNINPLIDAATNLVRLTLSSLSAVQLDKLAKVKYLSLDNCHVILDSFKNRISPLSISLNLVSFQRKENRFREILINDYIDFSQCSEISIQPCWNSVIIFDLSRDIVSARKVGFCRTRVINCKETQAKLDKKMLPFEQHSGMGIKQMTFRSCEVNFSVLPKSIEKLTLEMNTYSTVNCLSIDLPNLKCLYFQQLFDGSTAEMSPAAYDTGIIISMFRCCSKLVDMELSGWCSGWKCDIHVDVLPVTLKRIKLSSSENINFVGDSVIHVDMLILAPGNFADAQKFMDKIKPKIIVVQLQSEEEEEVEDPAGEIVSFVEASRNFEKMVIEVPTFDDLLLHRSYKESLSSYVEDDDGESEYYEFTNQVGKYLTKEEFKVYWF